MDQTIQVQFNHLWNEFAASKLSKWFSLSSLMSSLNVHAVVSLKIARAVWEGGANLRGLIMTPYYSLQELPSFAHHITCMAWHGNSRCMSFLTQLGTYWLQGKLLHESLAAVPACFEAKKGISQKALISFFSLHLLSKDWRKHHSLPAFIWSIKITILNIQRIATCLLLMWKSGINLKHTPSSVSFFERLSYVFFVSKTFICIALYKRAAVRLKVNATHFSMSRHKKSGWGVYF